MSKQPVSNEQRQQLIKAIDADLQASLRTQIEQCLQEVANYLLDRAKVAFSSQEQNYLFSSLTQLENLQSNIENQYTSDILSQFRAAVSGEKASNLDSSTSISDLQLAVVDKSEFEDWLNLSSMNKHVNQLSQFTLAQFYQRFSQLIGTEFGEENAPFSPYVLGREFLNLIAPVTIPSRHIDDCLALFETSITDCIVPFYREHNSKLEQAGFEVRDSDAEKPKKQAREKSRNEDKNVDTDTEIDPVASTESREISGSVAAQEESYVPSQHYASMDSGQAHAMYQSVARLLSMQQPAPAGGKTKPSQDHYAQTELSEALDSLQREMALIPGMYSNNALRGNIEEKLTEIAPSDPQKLLQQPDLNRIDVIDSLINVILSKQNVGDSDIELLKGLEFPLLKQSIVDDSFLHEDEHPIRKTLDILSRLYDFRGPQNHVVDRQIANSVKRINSEFDENPEIFSEVLPELDKLLTRQLNAYERNVERLKKTCEGKEKLEQANVDVDNELRKRLKDGTIPDIALQLLDNGWHDLLVLAYIRQGKRSKIWKEYLQVIDQLLLWLKPIDELEHDVLLERSLETESFTTQIEEQLDTAFPSQMRHVATIADLRQCLLGEKETLWVAFPERKEEMGEAAENFDDNPELEHWIKRCKELKEGLWLARFEGKEVSEQLRIAWIAKKSSRFALVNIRGEKETEYNLVEMAQQLMHGLIPIEDSEEWPVMDQGLLNIVQNIYGKLAHNSSHDELTGLVNRKEFERRLSVFLSKPKRQRVEGVLYAIHLDQYDVIAKHQSHDISNGLIAGIAKLLARALPENAELARTESNEFSVLIPAVDLEHGMRIADIHRKSIENFRLARNQEKFSSTASIGILPVVKADSSTETLVKHVELSQAMAKDKGGNRIELYHPDNKAQLEQSEIMDWLAHLESRLDQGMFRLRCHKIAPFNPNNSHGHYEILLGCSNKEGKIVSPQPFIEAAEKHQRMGAIDRWVVNTTFSAINSNEKIMERLGALSINISGSSLNDRDFHQFLQEQISELKTDPKKICFEVTETSAVASLTEAADFIRSIKTLGCQFSLDDFGTGMASYEYLKILPVDFVKIDGIFIRDIANFYGDRAIVQSINEIGHLMGKQTIAEYVENDHIADILKEIGVDYGQGYGIEHPFYMDEI